MEQAFVSRADYFGSSDHCLIGLRRHAASPSSQRAFRAALLEPVVITGEDQAVTPPTQKFATPMAKTAQFAKFLRRRIVFALPSVPFGWKADIGYPPEFRPSLTHPDAAHSIGRPATKETMARIFLSYAKEDRPFAQRLAEFLEASGHSVWWDRRLEGGEEFGAEIEAAIEQAAVVLVAWSKDSVKSRWVRDEASVGGDNGRLVPLSIDGTPPPIGFRQFHTIDVAGWKGRKHDARAAQILQSIERRLDGKQKAPVMAPAPTKRAMQMPRRGWLVAAALVTMAIAGLFLILNWQRSEQAGLAPTMALLPFTTSSPDAELRDLAAQARESVAHTLPQSGIPVRLIESASADAKSAGDYVISGELSKSADKVVATVRLAEATHGVTVYSTRIEADVNDLRNLPERVGAQVAGYLSDGSTLMLLDRRRPADPAVLAELLAETSDMLQSYQNNKRVAAKAPDVPGAQIGVAFFTGFVLGDLPREERRQALAEGRAAYDRALVLAPEYGDTYASWCLLHPEVLIAECEEHLRKGIRIDQDAPYLHAFLADLLRNVGRFDEAVELIRLSYNHDPYNVFKIRDQLWALEFSGDSEAASNLFRKGERWWPDVQSAFLRSRLVGVLDRGDLQRVRRVQADLGGSPDQRAHAMEGIDAAVKTHSVANVRRICGQVDAPLVQTSCMVAFGQLGDLNSAYALAEKLYPPRLGRTAAETERNWLEDPGGYQQPEFLMSPAAARLRRDPRFLVITQRLGILGYWRRGRVPDFCRKPGEPVCAQLSRRH